MTVARISKALPLFGFSLVEVAVAFLRMMILTHILGPYEFGFAAALSAIYATIEQVSDFSISRFVVSSPRSVYRDATAAAHAIAIIRGAVLAAIILFLAYPLACTYAACNEWFTFAWLAPVTIIKSFEHLEIKVGDRDYRYWPQLIASFISHSAGIIALLITAHETGSHYAFVAYLLVQAGVYTVASHALATSEYQIDFRSPYLRKAVTFGWPLVLNGAGLALIGQGDRLIIGALFGLPALGIYAVIILAGLVPISAVLRILGPLLFAGLHNVQIGSAEYIARLRFFSRALPMVAGCYALGLIGLLKAIVPLAFGARFIISDLAVVLIASIAFVRIVRIEPHTGLLMNKQKTRELAFANLIPGFGLLALFFITLFYPRIEAALVGLLVGELLGLIAMVFVTRTLLKPAIGDYWRSLLLVGATVLVAARIVLIPEIGDDLFIRLFVVAISGCIILACARIFLFGLYNSGYVSKTE